MLCWKLELKSTSIFIVLARENPGWDTDLGEFLATLELMLSFDSLHFSVVTKILIPWQDQSLMLVASPLTGSNKII